MWEFFYKVSGLKLIDALLMRSEMTPFHELGSPRNNTNDKSGNTEQGKCWLTNEYLFFLFFIGNWCYEKNILSLLKRPILAGTHS